MARVYPLATQNIKDRKLVQKEKRKRGKSKKERGEREREREERKDLLVQNGYFYNYLKLRSPTITHHCKQVVF